MKKICLLLAALVCLAACAAPQEATPTPAAASISEDCLSWTKEDWEAATPEQQTSAARYVLFHIADAFVPNFSEIIGETEPDAETQAQLGQSVEALRDQISRFFAQAADDVTLSEMVRSAEELIS